MLALKQTGERFEVNKIRKRAFTLAEVLITLGIIGIVAAMTIPNLIKNYQETQYKTAFKKAYAVASQAWKQAVYENPNTFTSRGGWTCTWPTGESADYNANDGRMDAFISKMKIVKTCIQTYGCWPTQYETNSVIGDYTDTRWAAPNYYAWISADGSCWSAAWKGGDESHLLLDTNCNKGPNKIGKDIFSLLLGIDGVVYFGIDDTTSTGKPVRSGGVCARYNNTLSLNGRTIDFKTYLK